MNLILLNPQQIQADQAIIDDVRQLSHIQQHLKLALGDQIKIGVKNGLKGTAVIQAITDQQLLLSDVDLQQSPPDKLPLTLVMALPRPKVLRRLIMDAVALGAAHIVLIHSYRVEKSYWQTPFLNQLDHYIELGLEQSGDTVVPEITIYKRFRPFVEDVLPSLIAGQHAYVAHPYAEAMMPTALNQPTVLVIGPEGGFIPFEVDLLEKNGVQAASIGSRILRCETAVASIVGRLFSN
jgi:16S rRNA (uracil1498-N3)-methyltransferase